MTVVEQGMGCHEKGAHPEPAAQPHSHDDRCPQLADDHFLNCVPGSHLRPNTDAEAAVLRSQAAADLDSVSMPVVSSKGSAMSLAPSELLLPATEPASVLVSYS